MAGKEDTVRVAFRADGEVERKGKTYHSVTFIRACDDGFVPKGSVYLATYKRPGKDGLETSHSVLLNEGLYQNLLSVANTEGDATGVFDGVADLVLAESKKEAFRVSEKSGKAYRAPAGDVIPVLTDEAVKGYAVPDKPFNLAEHNRAYRAAMQEAKARAKEAKTRERSLPSVEPETPLQNDVPSLP